uniref:Protein kinase domain-containing protein n=1 Tax=Alexandrium monilatum TaxID=311494 RepID=A0A7S4VH06_9DINO|mmetsp:Transcript_77612/g.231244  ORF Transcript_77612/g.231244 Transcript_77612/m.231244 type:complete len:323 (+) Transcript_77612:98-1066(+)
MVEEAAHAVVPSEWDSGRFRFVALLQEAPRNNGRVELLEDVQTGRLIAAKAMPMSWVCESHEAFMAAHPEESELPWRDILTTYHLSKVVGLSCVCEFMGLFHRQGQEGLEVCIVLSYCAGGDLFTWLERSLQLTGSSRELAARPLMRSVLLAVLGIHEQGFAHGDLSLENVLLVDAEERDPTAIKVCIIDFAASTGPRASGLRGKPSYQAPEVHSDQEYDAFAADAFSLGVMLFTIAVGNYPWRSTRPHVCPCFRYAADRGLPAYLARRKIRGNGDEQVTLAALLSPKLVSLLTGLLCMDGPSRLTPQAALEHPWFAEDRPP